MSMVWCVCVHTYTHMYMYMHTHTIKKLSIINKNPK